MAAIGGGGLQRCRWFLGLPRGKRTRRAAGSGASAGWIRRRAREQEEGLQGGGVSLARRGRLPTCQLVGLSICRKVGGMGRRGAGGASAAVKRCCRGWRGEGEDTGGRLQSAVTALRSHCRVLSGVGAAGERGGRARGGLGGGKYGVGGVVANFPACRFVDFPACREVGGTDRKGYADGGPASARAERQGRGSRV